MPIERPQLQVLSEADPSQRAWFQETKRAFKLYMLAHGRAPTTHVEYTQAILFIAKVLYDKFGRKTSE